jgi:RES domain-containing protein
MLNAADLPDWHVEGAEPSRAYGEAWQQGKRSLILIVPSVVARIEKNILINPEHPEFPQIETSLHQPVWWDKRLFAA